MNIVDNAPISVALVDADDILRSGCRAIFNEDPRFHFVGDAPRLSTFRDLNYGSNLDVLIFDPMSTRVGGSEVIEDLVHDFPDTRLLVLTDTPDVSFYVDALQAGARGVFLKGHTPGWLLLNVADLIARSGSVVIDRSIMLRLKLGGVAWRSRESKAVLSPRELDVVRLLSAGLSDDEVARTLGIARATVHTHVSAIMRKVPATNRVQLGIYLLNAGVVDDECPLQVPAQRAS